MGTEISPVVVPLAVTLSTKDCAAFCAADGSIPRARAKLYGVSSLKAHSRDAASLIGKDKSSSKGKPDSSFQ